MTSTLTIQDLTSHKNQRKNDDGELRFIEVIPSLSNQELIIALSNRYYNLSDKALQMLILEIKSRALAPIVIDQLYSNIKLFLGSKKSACPCCQTSSLLTIHSRIITNCLICGFDIKFDNPSSILNRIRWRFKIYSFTRLSLIETKELIMK